ncbi:MAG: M48 family metallopeptidase [Gammaproteobacteria bacterium]
MRLASFLIAFVFGLLPGVAAAGAPVPDSAAAAATSSQDVFNLNLPKLGLAGGGAFPLWKAEFIGRQIYYEIQEEGGVLNDPLVASYADYLGHRLSSVANGPDEPFHYFAVLDPEINAFALPGAFVGVNSGLIEATRSEDELAGVLAHETAHVVQRHIAREVADSHYNNLIDLAILLGAIAVAAANPDLAAGAITGAEGGVTQRAVNYTRADEMEADRVGISILARAHFNPQGMIEFFEYMEQEYALQGYQIPEFLSDHPLDLTRISEAEERAKNLHVMAAPEDPNYALMKARIRVLTSDDLDATLVYFRTQSKVRSDPWYRKAAVYGEVLCLTQLNEGKQALALIKPLAAAHSDNIALQLALAEAMIAAGQTKAGLEALAQDNALYAPSLPTAMTYARALFNANKFGQTVAVLLPLAQLDGNDPIYDPDLYQLLGSAADKSGNQGLSYLSMANYFAGRGQYRFAIIQLRLGLETPNLSPGRREQMQSLRKQLEADQKQAKKLGVAQ